MLARSVVSLSANNSFLRGTPLGTWGAVVQPRVLSVPARLQRTGLYSGVIPEIPNATIYPIDRIEEKFSSYFLTSSLALMAALAIDEIENIRKEVGHNPDDDVIGLWGVDMAAMEEYGYQRPGCQFFVLEALRRGIGVYVPPESDLMRPQPV